MNIELGEFLVGKVFYYDDHKTFYTVLKYHRETKLYDLMSDAGDPVPAYIEGIMSIIEYYNSNEELLKEIKSKFPEEFI